MHEQERAATDEAGLVVWNDYFKEFGPTTGAIRTPGSVSCLSSSSSPASYLEPDATVVGGNCHSRSGGPLGPTTTLTRAQDAVAIRLLAARGGTLVEEVLLLGPEPPPCPKDVNPAGGLNISEPGVQPQEIEAWLQTDIDAVGSSNCTVVPPPTRPARPAANTFAVAVGL